MASARVNAVYYPSWKVYKGKPPSCLDVSVTTHVFYAFVRYVCQIRGAAAHTDDSEPSVNEDGTLRVCLYRIPRNMVQRDAHSVMDCSSSINGATLRKKSTAKKAASRHSQSSRAKTRTSRPSCRSAAVQEARSSPIWLPTLLPGRHLRWGLVNSATAMGLTGSIVRLVLSDAGSS